MFEDNRSKRIMIVAHCIMNQNAISDSSANLPSQFAEIVDLIMKEKIGLVQLPCPELQCLGLDRKDRLGGARPVLEENTRIRDLMTKKDNLKLLEREVKKILFQGHVQKSLQFRFMRSPTSPVHAAFFSNPRCSSISDCLI